LLAGDQLHAHCSHDVLGHLGLDRQDVRHDAVVAVGTHGSIGRDKDELGRDPHAALASAAGVRLVGPLAAPAAEGVLGLAGLVDLRAEGEAEEPQVQVKVDLDAAGRASVKPGDVRRSAATVFSGLGVGYLFEEQKIEDVVVWSAPETRRSLNDLRDLWVERADSRHVRLADVATRPKRRHQRHLAEQRDDAVEPQLVKGPQEAAGLGDLEDPEPAGGTQDARELVAYLKTLKSR